LLQQIRVEVSGSIEDLRADNHAVLPVEHDEGSDSLLL
jgi:hypothetical protein